ncbi:MAG: hypothetical protein GF400_04915 [Candidatus Eisenbacteria bacterium]|nr:hypothetical protein [Candidatus Eisenbacteria bacterium]
MLLAILLPAVADSLPGSGREAWYETSIAGLRAGVIHETVKTAADGSLVTTSLATVTVRRFGERVVLSQSDVWRETANGQPLEYTSVRRLARGEEIELSVTVETDRLLISKSTGREDYSAEHELETSLLFPLAVERLHVERGFVPGDSYSYATFDPDFEAVTTCSVCVVGPDTLRTADGPVAAEHIRVYPDVYDGAAVDEWLSESGALWLQEFESLGVVTRRTSRREAEREFTPPDISAETLIESNVRFHRPWLVEEALYELWLDSGVPDEVAVTGGRQQIVGRTERGVLLRVVSSEGTAGCGSGASNERVSSQYLEANVLLQKDAPAIADAARAAVSGAEGDPRAMAEGISRAVAGLVHDRGYGTAFASATEVLETGEGDCSEHAVLAAAMARAVGLPSRLAVGLVHFDGAFAYHMWVEMWTGSCWYAVDPTEGRAGVDATHITLDVSALGEGSVGGLSLAVLSTANRLNLRVVEYVEDGARKSAR